MGIIIYEFLIGVVPFLGETPEQLFANIISEEAEFPEGEEALPVEAESLIALLLEKNPNERLATVGGAQQVRLFCCGCCCCSCSCSYTRPHKRVCPNSIEVTLESPL
ncbi:unnamed protein product [Anisakis simplex]|uniref:non-specific serine/threonine protein kinase n=1 Tax=Anisakis simplex TaxID=6269 RepID=A0A0M3JNL7_ANISI|nr:unnamed protein product [Anisakis simplex]